MTLHKTFSFGDADIHVTAIQSHDGILVESIMAIVKHDNGVPKWFNDNIGNALLEYLPGFRELVEGLDWSEEIKSSEDSMRDDLHDLFFGDMYAA